MPFILIGALSTASTGCQDLQINWENIGMLLAVNGNLEMRGNERVPIIYIVGENGSMLHYNGNDWKQVGDIEGVDLYGVCAGQSTWIAVGCDAVQDGHIFRLQSGTWEHLNIGTVPCLYGVTWAPDLYFVAVGEQGTILRSDVNGRSWLPDSSNTDVHLRDVFATSRYNVMAVGDSGSILHFNGTEWSPMQSPVTANLRGVYHARSSTEAYAVGGDGTILKYAGSDWTEMNSGTSSNLFSVHGAFWDKQIGLGYSVFAVGTLGTILRLEGTDWRAEESDTLQDLLDIWGFDISEHVATYAVGSEATVLELVFHE